MNEVEIPIKITGIGSLKTDLRNLKEEIANATDPADMQRLVEKAGEVADRIKDANEQVSVFTTGSKFEKVSNSFSLMSNDLMSLDFEGANEKATVFAGALGKIGKADISGAIKGITGMVGKLGTAFLTLGMQILVNPIFLLVVVIIAIVAAVGFFLDKIGVLGVVLDFIMIPINAIIDALKWLGDALGLTSFAEDEEAAKAEARAKAKQEQFVREMEAIEALKLTKKNAYDSQDKAASREIALMKALGKDTTDLERARIKASISYQTNLVKETAKQYAQIKANQKSQKELIEHMKIVDPATFAATGMQEQLNKLKEAENKIETENIAANESLLDLKNQLKIFEIDLSKTKIANDKEAVAKSTKANEKIQGDIKNNEANSLSSARKIRDGEISIMQDGIAKEEAITIEKFKRQREDIASNEKYKAAEKATLTDQANAEEDKELKAKGEAARKTTILVENELAQLRLEAMKEGAEKDLIIQNQKYQTLRDAAIADTRLTAEQLKEKLDLYNTMQIEEETARMKDKVKAASDLLTELTTTENEKKIAELEAKYLAEQEMAMGNQKALEILEANHKKALANIDIEASNAKVETAQKERDAKLSFAKDTVAGLANLGGMLIKDQKKLEKMNKATALIQIGIDTAKAISALVAAANTNPLNGVTAGAAGIAQFASGIIQIATNVAKAKQILSAPGATPSTGGGGGGGGGSTSAATALPQAAQLFGSSNTGGSFSAGGDSSSSMTVTAIVSETQVTSTQQKINRINKSSEL